MQILELEAPFRKWADQPYPLGKFGAHFSNGHPQCSDIADLVEMFKSFGSVLSVEVSRNPETGVSRGCGYITMSSIESARNAVSALDGSFGVVDSARVLYDRRGGKSRTYAFLSFSSSAERDAALSMNGTDFHDRLLVVKRGLRDDQALTEILLLAYM
ncbi:hypothetical protein Peur_048281 [Populus x canadensis]